MRNWLFGSGPGMSTVAHSTSSLVVAAAQVVRLEILAAAYEGKPEESALILRRLEIACLQAGRPLEALAAHERALPYFARCGDTARARWESSPRWFQRLAGSFQSTIELLWENAQYRRITVIINRTLALDPPTRLKVAA